jgi:hypothetical protein
VLIRNATILAMESVGEEVIDATGRIVIPGMVDTHRHMREGVLRGHAIADTLDTYFRRVLLNDELLPDDDALVTMGLETQNGGDDAERHNAALAEDLDLMTAHHVRAEIRPSRLRDLGALRPGTTFVHGNGLDGDELEAAMSVANAQAGGRSVPSRRIPIPQTISGEMADVIAAPAVSRVSRWPASRRLPEEWRRVCGSFRERPGRRWPGPRLEAGRCCARGPWRRSGGAGP